MVYKKKWPLAILLSFLMIFLISIFVVVRQNTFDRLKNTRIQNIETFTINNQALKLEIVSSSTDRYQGLSGRKSLCSNCGMLFVFSDLAPRSFVMRNMLIPLDIIFIANDYIIKIDKNLVPEGASPKNIYESLVPIDKVLEINAGQSDVFGLKIGDKLEIKKDE
jgi:uncharacterized membrane protein (UPF0127 family)